jgi:PTH1 family peptidyl-tRNA hydrolase
VIDALLHHCSGISRERAPHADITVCSAPGDVTVACIKPLTFVNRSGIAVKECLTRYALQPGKCLIVVDDFNLPLGTIRFRRQGSDGGHNGLKSIIAENGDDFPRLRIGIGPKPAGIQTVDFVLSRFADHETGSMHAIVQTAAEAVLFFCGAGIEAAMNKYNH